MRLHHGKKSQSQVFALLAPTHGKYGHVFLALCLLFIIEYCSLPLVPLMAHVLSFAKSLPRGVF